MRQAVNSAPLRAARPMHRFSPELGCLPGPWLRRPRGPSPPLWPSTAAAARGDAAACESHRKTRPAGSSSTTFLRYVAPSFVHETPRTACCVPLSSSSPLLPR